MAARIPTSGSMSSSATSRNVFSSCRGGTTSTTINPAGAADEELFIRSFEDVPRIQISSSNEMVSLMSEINHTLEENSEDWEKRVACLKKFRSLVSNGYAEQYSRDFLSNLRGVPFENSLRDLRSKVMNETAITIAYICQIMGSKVDRWMEELLPVLFKSLQSSAKFISTSAIVAIRFVIQFTHSSRLIPVICNNMGDKSKPIRKAVCESLDQLLHTWPRHCLEKHQLLLCDTIRKGINDADPEARVFARRAFWGFSDHFRDAADSLMSSLDPSKQKLLHDEMGPPLSTSNSSNSISNFSHTSHRVDGPACGARSLNYHHGPSVGHSSRIGFYGKTRQSVSASNSIENLARPWSSMSSTPSGSSRIPGVKSRIPVYSPKEASNGKFKIENLLATRHGHRLCLLVC